MVVIREIERRNRNKTTTRLYKLNEMCQWDCVHSFQLLFERLSTFVLAFSAHILYYPLRFFIYTLIVDVLYLRENLNSTEIRFHYSLQPSEWCLFLLGNTLD